MAITGMVGGVYVSDVSIPPVPFLDVTTIADAGNKRFQVVDPALRYWPLDAAIIVKVDGVEVTTGFKLERAGGFVEFDKASGAMVTISGTALTLAQAGGFFNWSIDGDGDDAEATTFASQGWKEFVRTLNGWSGSAEAYWGDTRFFEALGKVVVVKLFVDAGPAQSCMEGFAIISGEGIEVPVEGLVQENIDFTGTGPLYIRM